MASMLKIAGLARFSRFLVIPYSRMDNGNSQISLCVFISLCCYGGPVIVAENKQEMRANKKPQQEA